MYLLNQQMLNFFLFNKEKLGCGLEGTCYKIASDKVLKIYDRKLEIETRRDTFNREYFLRFRDLEIKNFYFIREVVYVLCYLQGTITEYAPGNSLKNRPLFYEPIDEVLLAIEELIKSIKKLSDEGIYTNDLFEGNVLYTPGRLSIIDTAHFFSERDDDPASIYRSNLIDIMRIIIESLFKIELFEPNLIQRLLHKLNSPYKNLSNYEFCASITETINSVRSILEDYCEIELTSFSDVVPILEKKLK